MLRPIALLAIALVSTACAGEIASPAEGVSPGSNGTAAPAGAIKHVVVIIQENESFDHYFATYPTAANPGGEPQFVLAPAAPVNGLSGSLLSANPNFLNAANGGAAANPFRLDRTQLTVADQNHSYSAEQRAFDAGAMDLFPRWTGSGYPLVMGFYDGNTVTALWNYAARFSMSQNSFGTEFGPSLVGYLNIASGQTNGAVGNVDENGALVADGSGGFTVVANVDPLNDVCSGAPESGIQMAGRNIGDLLSGGSVSWGYFVGGFNLATTNPNGSNGCRRATTSVYTGVSNLDYADVVEPFQYYPSTANPLHLRPTSPLTVGTSSDPANHQYDLGDFFSAVQAGNFPQVNFLRPTRTADGHAGYSSALDEQAFLVQTLNFLQARPEWNSTVAIIMWDDSDGWYDHLLGPTVNGSTSAQDFLDAPGRCGSGVSFLPGISGLPANGRCGYGPRLPLLVVSPWARHGFVDQTLTDQTSVIRLIEDLYLGGERLGGGSFDSLAGSLGNMFDFSQPVPQNGVPLLLDPATGIPRG